MKFKNVNYVGMPMGYMAFILTSLFYFTAPVWMLVLSLFLDTIFGAELARKVFPFIAYFCISIPSIWCCIGSVLVYRTREWSTFCTVIGTLIPTLVLAAYFFGYLALK